MAKKYFTEIRLKFFRETLFLKYQELQIRECRAQFVQRFLFQNNLEMKDGFGEKNIEGISRDWKKKGEYYYYTKPLKKGESVDFFTGVSVPFFWTEDYSGQKLRIGIQADAIQAANFHPDFQEMSPWGNQIVEKCIHETNGKTDCKLEDVELSVKFHGDAQKLLAVPADFFRNFGSYSSR